MPENRSFELDEPNDIKNIKKFINMKKSSIGNRCRWFYRISSCRRVINKKFLC